MSINFVNEIALLTAVQPASSHRPFHRLVNDVYCGEVFAEVAFVAVDGLVAICDQVDVAVMVVRWCDGEIANQIVAHVDFDVGFVAVVDLAVFNAVAAVFVHVLELFLCVFDGFVFAPCLFFLLDAFFPLVCFDEAGVLDDAFFDLVAFSVELPLQLIPDFLVDLGFFEAVLGIRNGERELQGFYKELFKPLNCYLRGSFSLNFLKFRLTEIFILSRSVYEIRVI
jgi:Na+-transporting NADH:ubiquinone oxidoreductase subunit NqrE